MTKKRMAIMLAVVIMLAGFFWLRSRQPSTEFEVLPHQVGSVERGDVVRTISLSGHLIPVAERRHQPQQGGEIVSIKVEPGDQVQKGDLLYRLDDRQARLDYLQVKNAYQQASIHGTQQEIAEQELRLELAEKNLEDRSICAVIDGTVADFDLEVEDYLNPEAGGIKVQDKSSFLVKVEIDEIDAPLISLGQESMIEVDALPDNNFKGEVTTVKHGTLQKNGQVVVPAEVSIKDHDQILRAGYSADVEIIIQSSKDVLVVPTTAIFEREGQKYAVTVDEEYNPRAVAVETGLNDDLNVEIAAGLDEGNAILINAYSFADLADSFLRFFPGGPPPSEEAGSS